MSESTAGCIIVLVGLLATPFLYVLNGWVLTNLWRWFMVPQFGLPPLALPYAIGVSLVVGFLTHQVLSPSHSDDRDAEKKLGDAITCVIASFLSPAIVLLVGWIVKGFVATG